MDHIIRDAAENHHPTYNDKAWEKMEAMLDKQLPQKGQEKIYFLPVVLFAAGWGNFIFYLPGKPG